MDSLNASRIAGGNSAYGRSQSDFYPTPPDVTVALMRFLNLPRTTSVWEPATGEGDMAGVLQTYFETVYATDILDGTDFLKSSIDAADWISRTRLSRWRRRLSAEQRSWASLSRSC